MCFNRGAYEEEVKDYPESMTYSEACACFKMNYRTLKNRIASGYVVEIDDLGRKRVSKSATIDNIERLNIK